MSATFSLTRVSTCRFLIRASGSLKVFGRLARAGVRIVGSFVTLRDSSPLFVRVGVPVISAYHLSSRTVHVSWISIPRISPRLARW